MTMGVSCMHRDAVFGGVQAGVWTAPDWVRAPQRSHTPLGVQLASRHTATGNSAGTVGRGSGLLVMGGSEGKLCPGPHWMTFWLPKHRRGRVKRALRRVARAMIGAGFITSPKGVLNPPRRLDFVAAEVGNGKQNGVAEVLAEGLCTWWIASKNVRGMLGKGRWAVRPSGGAGAFLADLCAALKGVSRGAVAPTKVAARGLGTASLPAHLPQVQVPQGQGNPPLLQCGGEGTPLLQSGGGRAVGFQGCPELSGLYTAMKVAAYVHSNPTGGGKRAGVGVGTDNERAGRKALRGHAASDRGVQQRTVCGIFFGSGPGVGPQWVPSPLNPALGRLKSLPSKKAA